MSSDPRTALTPRCDFVFTDGRRCRMLRCDYHPSLCLYHFTKLAREQGRPVSRSTVTVRGHLNNHVAVRRAVRRLAAALEDGRVAPRQATVMLNLCNLLIRTSRRSPRPRAKPPA